MRDHVSAQVAGVVEAGGALAAGVRFLSRVSPQVDLQAAVLREALPALRTSVGLLAGVNAHVDAQRGLVDERFATQGARNGRLPRVSRPVDDQVLAGEEALAAEAAVQRLVDSVRVDVVLLGELADMTGVTCLTLGSQYCFYCRVQCGRSHLSRRVSIQLSVPHQGATVVLRRSHWCSVTGPGAEAEEAVVGDAVVWGQGAESLELRGGEECVALLLQGPLSSAVDTHDPQLLALLSPAGGASRI